MLRCGETVAEEEDDDEYAKLVRRMNPPRYVHVRWQHRLAAGAASLGARRLNLLAVFAASRCVLVDC